MRIIVYLPFLAALLLGVAGPFLAGRLPPRTGTRLLLAAGVVSAGASLISLALLAGTLIARLPLVAAVGEWSSPLFHHEDPVPPVTGGLAACALAVLAGVVAWTTTRRLRALREVRSAGRRLGRRTGRLVVVDQPGLEAFAVPGEGADDGHIVVSTGMLRTLDAAGRRVLLAHEAAHLTHRHHRHRALAAVTAAANPLLGTLPAAVHHLTERWADEAAAEDVTDRRLTARTLARVALAARDTPRPADGGAVLCFDHFDHGGVPRRVRALLAATPSHRPATAAVLIALLGASLLSAGEAGRDAAQLLDQVRDRYHGPSVGLTTAVDRETRRIALPLPSDLHLLAHDDRSGLR